MAYVTKDIEDDEEQNGGTAGAQAAPSSGGTPTMRPGQPSASTGQPAPQQTPQQQQGSGFTNLSAWLNAGKGRDKSILDTGRQKIGEERLKHAGQAGGVENASYNANVWDDPGAEVDKAVASGDTSALEGGIAQTSGISADINYDPNAQKNMWDVNSLSSADTAGQVLGKDAMDRGEYGQGAQELDRILFGADSSSRAAIDETKKYKDWFIGDVASRGEAAKAKVAGFDKAAAEASAKNRERLTNYQSEMMKGVNERVEAAKKRQAETRAMLEANPDMLLRPPGPTRDDPYGDKLQGGEIRTINEGTEANVGNIATEKELKGFDVLAKLLGLPSVQKTGEYRDISTSVTKDPNYVAPLRDLGNPRPGTITSMLDGDINDPSTPKGAYQKAFMEYGPGARGGMYSAEENRAFLDRFRRENPQWADLIPDQAAVEAWEKSPDRANDPNSATFMPKPGEGSEPISTPFGMMTKDDWTKLSGFEQTSAGQNKVKNDAAAAVNQVASNVPNLFGNQTTPVQAATQVKDDAAATLDEIKKQMPWLFGG